MLKVGVSARPRCCGWHVAPHAVPINPENVPVADHEVVASGSALLDGSGDVPVANASRNLRASVASPANELRRRYRPGDLFERDASPVVRA